ncbi:MAG: hypothetical protein E7641_07620 [Ruminococcaceae bacterium]|nr:hypothetical protein [Oscillospiraceae bacterium]
MDRNSIMIELIRSEVCSRDSAQLSADQLTEEALLDLYKLSNSHDMAHIVASALERSGALPKGREITSKFERQKLTAFFRYEQINYALEELCDTLEAAEVAFIPLKGSVIRGYYPEGWLRTSCDIDVLIHEEDLDRATSVLVERLGYKFEKRASHDVSLYSDGGVHVELHFDLIEENRFPRMVKTLSSVWDHAILAEGASYKHFLSDEMFFYYHIAHTAKHFTGGGCGIRPVLDLWILNHCLSARDTEKRRALLEEGGLLRFADSLERLSEVWFSGFEKDDVSAALEEYILSGGVYGNTENGVAVGKNKKGGRVKYIFSRIFRPYKYLAAQYPILKKHKWLTPVYEVVRWFKVIFEGRLGRYTRELKATTSVSREKLDSTADLLSEIGLDEI